MSTKTRKSKKSQKTKGKAPFFHEPTMLVDETVASDTMAPKPDEDTVQTSAADRLQKFKDLQKRKVKTKANTVDEGRMNPAVRTVKRSLPSISASIQTPSSKPKLRRRPWKPSVLKLAW